MTEAHRTYLPSIGLHWALPLYDPLVTLLGGNSTRKALIDLASLRPGHRVLEIGCGTGSLVALIKHLHPDVEVVGLDPDPKALARAQRKAQQSSVSVHFDQGFSEEMPYPDASFDRVFSSFMFHHLAANEKERTLSEVHRVLVPRGLLLMLDFAGSASHDWLGHVLHSSGKLRDDTEDRVLALMKQAGFPKPRKVRDGSLLLGQIRLRYYEAVAAQAAH